MGRCPGSISTPYQIRRARRRADQGVDSCWAVCRQEDQAKFPWALPKNLWPKEPGSKDWKMVEDRKSHQEIPELETNCKALGKVMQEAGFEFIATGLDLYVIIHLSCLI